MAFGDIVIESANYRVSGNGAVSIYGRIRSLAAFVQGSIWAQVKDDQNVIVLFPTPGADFELVLNQTLDYDFQIDSPNLLPNYGAYVIEIFVLDIQGNALATNIPINVIFTITPQLNIPIILGTLGVVGFIGGIILFRRRR